MKRGYMNIETEFSSIGLAGFLRWKKKSVTLLFQVIFVQAPLLCTDRLCKQEDLQNFEVLHSYLLADTDKRQLEFNVLPG